MPTIVISELQRRGSLQGLFGHYNVGYRRDGVHYGLGRVSCPEGAVWSEAANACVCRTGRVWAPDNSKCVSPQSSLITGAQPIIRGQTGPAFSQQELSAGARRYIESQGHTIRCKIDDRWAATPAGGDPSRVCSIDGGPYKFGAYAINANPRSVLTSLARSQAIQTLEAQGVNPNTIEGSIAVSNLTNAIDAGITQQQVAAGGGTQGGGTAIDPGGALMPNIIASPGYVPPEGVTDSGGLPYYPPGSAPNSGETVNNGSPSGPLDFAAAAAQGSAGFDGSVSIGGADIPLWLLAVGAAAAFMAFKK